MNRYLVQFYIGQDKFSYPQEAENSARAFKQAESEHASKGRPVPDSMSITLYADVRPKLQLRELL